MLDMMFRYLPILGITIVINIVLGMYYNIGVSCENFNWKKLLLGVVKSIVIAFAFLGLAYCFDTTGTIIDLGAFELNPETIMTSAIALYMVKDTISLANILGVKKSETNTVSSTKRIEQRDPLDK